MHRIQFNACLRKRKRDEENTGMWVRYAIQEPKQFVSALGFPNARVMIGKDCLSVVDGVNVVAYCGTLLGPEPVYVTESGRLVPIQLFKQNAPILECDANVVDDVVPDILSFLNVRDACALGMVCRRWHSIVKCDTKYWKGQARMLHASSSVKNPRRFCLALTLNGFKPSHSAQLRKKLRENTNTLFVMWFMTSFLRRQVHRVELRAPADFKETKTYAGKDSFVLVATTRDFYAMFVFVQNGTTVLWKVSDTHTWNVTSDCKMVNTYSDWIGACSPLL